MGDVHLHLWIQTAFKLRCYVCIELSPLGRSLGLVNRKQDIPICRFKRDSIDYKSGHIVVETGFVVCQVGKTLRLFRVMA